MGYGNFMKALYTMFQVLTGESWSEAAARPALNYFYDTQDGLNILITYVFFYSFVLINSFTLLNVVVAVLMDGMSPSQKDHSGEIIANLKEQMAVQDQKLDEIMAE